MPQPSPGFLKAHSIRSLPDSYSELRFILFVVDFSGLSQFLKSGVLRGVLTIKSWSTLSKNVVYFYNVHLIII